MRKKTILLTMITVMTISGAIAGCKAKSSHSEAAQAETTVAESQKEASTEAASEEAASEETTSGETTEAGSNNASEVKEVVTLGIFKSEDRLDGNGGLARFTDENGNDFMANISDETEVPEKFEVGATYAITHSNIMTKSFPGIYPQVTKIELSDKKLEVTKKTS